MIKLALSRTFVNKKEVLICHVVDVTVIKSDFIIALLYILQCWFFFFWNFGKFDKEGKFGKSGGKS